jgi:RNA polymerase sigma factor (sigma-70 family)
VSLAVAVPFILAGVSEAKPGRRPKLPLGGRTAPSASAETDAARDEERRLVERAQTGDRAAVGELLSRHGPALYRSVLLPRLGSEAAAKDALSDVYERVVGRLDRFTWQNVGFWPWLRTVALRVAIDHLRARKRLVLWEAEDVEREVDAAQTATPVDQKLSEQRDRAAARARVEEALGRIHPRYATAVRLRVLEEKPRDEVARELGVSAATFDVVLHRAMQALRKVLGAPGDSKAAPAPAARTKQDEPPANPGSSRSPEAPDVEP